MNNNKQREPSQKLKELLVELKITISELKELYKKIDKIALEEGFGVEEIYDIDMSTTKSSVVSSTTTTNVSTTIATTNNNNKKEEEKKYFQRYFQHFQ